jgi:hypothetical protein
MVAIWGCHAAVLAISLGAKSYPIIALIALTVAWFVTAISSVAIARGWRIKTTGVVLASGILMKNTFLYVLLAIACARGHCV